MGIKKRKQTTTTEWVASLEETEPTEGSKHHMFKVVLINDDYTPMEFVVEVLKRFFKMSSEVANQVMLQVHQQGQGMCGVFARDVAETKVIQVNEFARRNQHPLLCRMEED